MTKKFVVIVPTLNAMLPWPEWQVALARQSIAPAQIVIMDFQSTDGTAEAARRPETCAATRIGTGLA